MVQYFRLAALALLPSVGMGNAAKAASFDCYKATTDTEIAICNVPELSSLDDFMVVWWKGQNKIYKTVNSQKNWLIKRDKCLGITECIKDAYIERLAEYPMAESAVSYTETKIHSTMLKLYDTILQESIWAKHDYYLCGAYNQCSSIYTVRDNKLRHLPAIIPKFDESENTCGIKIEVNSKVKMLSTVFYDIKGELTASFENITLFSKWVGHGDKSDAVTYELRNGKLSPVAAKLDNCLDNKIGYKDIYLTIKSADAK